jgi:phospholipase/carboxylesterase
MNRLPSEAFSSAGSTTSTAQFLGAGKFESDSANGQHVLFAPLHYEANYGYPLLVWLHGGGDSEKQLRRIMPHISLRNYVAVAPRGTLSVPHVSGHGEGYCWAQTPEQIAIAEQRIQNAIEAAEERYNIRPDRIFIAGYESGGTMAFRIAADCAPQFAGVISLCGAFPTQGAPLANLNALRRLPLFVAACRQGVFYRTEQVCDNLRLFHSAGMSITLKEYPGEDSLSQMMLADIDRWMMEQISTPTPLVSAQGHG